MSLSRNNFLIIPENFQKIPTSKYPVAIIAYHLRKVQNLKNIRAKNIKTHNLKMY